MLFLDTEYRDIGVSLVVGMGMGCGRVAVVMGVMDIVGGMGVS